MHKTKTAHEEGTTPESKKKKKPALDAVSLTTEATSYLQGLFAAFQEQTKGYHDLTKSLLHVEARIELAEKTLCLTRDHLANTIKQTDSAVPNDWDKVLRSVMFVGVRLVDACATLLQESKNKKLTPDELLKGLNEGMFRFRTNSPLREIHAAMLKQTFATRTGQYWVWNGSADQIPLRLKVVKATMPREEKKEAVN